MRQTLREHKPVNSTNNAAAFYFLKFPGKKEKKMKEGHALGERPSHEEEYLDMTRVCDLREALRNQRAAHGPQPCPLVAR